MRAPALSETQRRAVARDLANAVAGEVRFGAHDRMLYATDASLYQVEPIGVVIPAGVEDAAAAVAFCAARGLPILPRGGGTSLAGQCTNHAVVIDFSAHCRAIRSVDASARTCEVEAGITVDELNDALAGHGLFFAPDPATSRQCNIGGCIGNNAAGGRSIRYGRTSESLIGVDAMLSDGSRVCLRAGESDRDPRARDITRRVAEVVQQHARAIRARFPRTIRRNAGYNLDLILAQMDGAGPRADGDAVLRAINLSHLVCGSEGTLAVTLGAELALHPVPRARGLAVLGFGGVDEAIEAVVPILALRPSAVELLDDLVLRLAGENAEYRRYVGLMPSLGGEHGVRGVGGAGGAGGAPAAVLYVEFLGEHGMEEVRAGFDALQRLLPGVPMRTFTDAGEMGAAWKLRKAGEPLLHGIPGDRKPITFVEDNAVPVERLAEFVRAFRGIVASHGTTAAFWAHASVGVLHVRPLLNLRDDADRARMLAIAVEVADLARSLGGVMSGEHGDGRVRGPLLERFFGPELMGAFRQIKAIFDPRGLLNPGNIVEPAPIESILARTRISPSAEGWRAVHAPAVETYFDFGSHGGLLGAAEQCNGAGVCRKKRGGTMCPSYMATLDERHSTRGRGNALRLAISGQLGTRNEGTGSPWNDPDTIETLALCLSCKACKAECPSNVDIARLKAEYTAQRYAERGAPLGARLLANVRALNRLASLAPSLANAIAGSRPARWLQAGILGFSPRRAPPAFSASLARVWGRWRSEPGWRAPAPDARRVVLVGDCFTMYNEPSIGLAAGRLIEAFGYRAELLDAGCCGRAAISLGVLDTARSQIAHAAARLRHAADDPGVAALLVCEPSCLSAVRDDWRGLRGVGDGATLRRIAERTSLPEEFFERQWDTHPRRPAFASPPPGGALLHAHCHQKALWGVDSSAAFLRRLLGEGGLQLPDTGCCGMAGAFGFGAETYDLSMRVGEVSVFPAVRAARGADDAPAILATGTSCRHQIRDGTGVTAAHPVELASDLLRVPGAGAPAAEP